MRRPDLPTSTLKKTYKFTNHTAELHDGTERGGLISRVGGQFEYYEGRRGEGIVYLFVMVVAANNSNGAVLCIASETSPLAIRNNEPPFLCLYGGVYFGQGGGHLNYGSSALWQDVEAFADEASRIICERLDEVEVAPSEKKRWQFWR